MDFFGTESLGTDGILLRWHGRFVGGKDTADQFAFAPFACDEGSSAIAPLGKLVVGLEVQAPFGFLRIVARQAIGSEDR